MPNVVCDNFFERFSQSLLENNHLTTTRMGSRAHSDGNLSRGGPSRPARRQHRVRVECRLRQLDRRSGSQLTRRHLTQVREEPADDHDDDDGQHQDDCYDINYSRDDEVPVIAGDSSAAAAAASADQVSERSDFGLFLERQQRQTSTARRAGGGRQRTRTTSTTTTTTKAAGQQDAANQQEAHCYELFCFHNSNLLVHRNQVTVEAERLARRLAALTEPIESAS